MTVLVVNQKGKTSTLAAIAADFKVILPPTVKLASLHSSKLSGLHLAHLSLADINICMLTLSLFRPVFNYLTRIRYLLIDL